MAIILETGVDQSGLRAGLAQSASLVDQYVAKVNAKLAAAGKTTLSGMVGVGNAATSMQKMIGISGQLTASLEKLSGLFNSALGVGTLVGGLGLLGAAFTRAIEKAKQFQTAQIAIAASIQSSYKITGAGGRALNPIVAFDVSMREAQRINTEIIQRQAKNILNYQEQLSAFQSSVAPGSRKGLSTTQVMNVSEQAAIVAKTLGLRGEEIANASRLLLGGGVNVARSTIGRALGVSNQEIAGKSGDEFYKFIMGKMSGFQTAEPSFAKSIEGILSTLESQFDVFFAKIGKRFIEKLQPSLQSFGKMLQGPGAEQFADTLVTLFSSLFKALEQIGKSPAIPIFMQFLKFIANYGDKILLGVVLTQILGIIGKVGLAGQGFVKMLQDITAWAAKASASVQGLSGSTAGLAESQSAATATGNGMMGGGGAAGAAAGLGAGIVGRGQLLSASQGKRIAALVAAGKTQEAEALATRWASARAGMGIANNPRLAGQLMQGGATMEQIAAQEAKGYVSSLVAGGAATAAGGGLLGRLRGAAGAALPVGGAMLRGGLTGMAISTGLELLTPDAVKQHSIFGPGIKGLEYGIPTYMTLAPMMGAGAAGPLAGFVAANSAMAASLNQTDARQQRTRDALREQEAKNPLAAQIARLKAQRGHFAAELKAGRQWDVDEQGVGTTGGKGFWGGWWFGRGGSGNYAEAQLTNKTLQGRVDALDMQIKDAEAGKGAEFEAQRQSSQKAYGDALLKVAEAGYGQPRVEQRLRAKMIQNLSKVHELFTQNALPVDKDIEAQVRKELSTPRSALSREYGITSSTKKEAFEDIVKQVGNERMEKRLTGEARLKYQDELKGVRLGRVAAFAGTGRGLQSEFQAGLATAEAGVYDKRETFGPQFDAALRRVREKFIHEFNMPLKQAEAKISALSLGVDSENLVDQISLTLKATRAKLAEMVDVPKAMRDRIARQAEAKAQADMSIARDTMERQAAGYGATPEERIRNRARSEIMQRSYRARGLLAGSNEMSMTQGMYGLLGELEGNRGSFSSTRSYAAYRRNSVGNYLRNAGFSLLEGQLQRQSLPIAQRLEDLQMQQGAFAVPQAELAASNAGLALQSFGYGLTNRGRRMMGRAERIVGREMEGNLSQEEAVKIVRERMENERKGLEIAKQQADIGIKVAQANEEQASITAQLNEIGRQRMALKLDSIEADYAQAVVAATQVLKDMPESKAGKVHAVKGADGRTVLTNLGPGDKTASPINITVEGQHTFSDAEIEGLSRRVGDALCEQLRRTRNRG